MKTMKYILAAVAFVALAACKSNKSADSAQVMTPVGPTFVADSAMAFCEAQCQFGPRTMNSEAHAACLRWIVDKFKGYGCTVNLQEATLKGYDGTPLQSANILASYKPEISHRIMLCAHWDSRPWADNDPDSANWRKPVMAANDAASGVAVMLEVARLVAQDDSLAVGIDFVCFDAEDWGVPQWANQADGSDTWALGAQHWAAQYAASQGSQPSFAVLLDMVGAQGARFYQEGYSLKYARPIVDKIWAAAKVVGYGSYFPESAGGYITDDHVPVNEVARIPAVDIIPYFPDCQQSSFGPTWHTVSDDMEHLDPTTLQAVGQTLIQVIYSER